MHDVISVALDRTSRKVELYSYFFVAVSTGQETNNFEFSFRQLVFGFVIRLPAANGAVSSFYNMRFRRRECAAVPQAPNR